MQHARCPYEKDEPHGDPRMVHVNARWWVECADPDCMAGPKGLDEHEAWQLWDGRLPSVSPAALPMIEALEAYAFSQGFMEATNFACRRLEELSTPVPASVIDELLEVFTGKGIAKERSLPAEVPTCSSTLEVITGRRSVLPPGDDQR